MGHSSLISDTFVPITSGEVRGNICCLNVADSALGCRRACPVFSSLATTIVSCQLRGGQSTVSATAVFTQSTGA